MPWKLSFAALRKKCQDYEERLIVRAIWCFIQHTGGILNAWACIDALDNGDYLRAAASAAVVLLMASVRLRATKE